MDPSRSLSEQIRQAVRDCGTTRYALAKQLHIAESTLARFLSGERGLRLDVLDALADVLGLQVVTIVARVNRPARRGPKKKEQKVKKQQGQAAPENSKHWWQRVAARFAKDANENFFQSRRGIWPLEDIDKLCYYNNNPYEDPTWRAEETAMIRAWLKANGIAELAYATYPETGDEAGYSFAMILDAAANRSSDIVAALNGIIGECHEKRSSQLQPQRKGR